MVTQLIGGSLVSMQIVFGPWWYHIDEVELRTRFARYKLMVNGELAKDQEEFEAFEELIEFTNMTMVEQSQDLYRLQYNQEVKTHEPPGFPLPRLDDVGVITDEMLEDLDRIFLSEYPSPRSHQFGHNSEETEEQEARYVEKVAQYLDRLAQREIRGLERKDYTERHRRLLRASLVFQIHYMPWYELPRLPFPTKSMVEALWVAMDPLDYGLMEVSNILFVCVDVRDGTSAPLPV